MRIKIINEENGRTVDLEVSNDIRIIELAFKYSKYIGDNIDFMDKNIRFRFKGRILKFERNLSDYHIKDGDAIRAFPEHLIYGGGPTRDCPGPTHVCPYGCGRQIPDDFKGCTELLKAIPNFFD